MSQTFKPNRKMSDERGSFIKGTYDGQSPYDAEGLRNRKPYVPIAEESEFGEMRRKLQLAVENLVLHNQIAIEGLTEKQVAEAIKQAVIAGDFQVMVSDRPSNPVTDPVWNGTVDLSSPRTMLESNHAQQVVYLPGRGVGELRAKVERMAKCIQVARDVVFSTECVSSCARNDRCARCKLADALNELDGQTGGEA